MSLITSDCLYVSRGVSLESEAVGQHKRKAKKLPVPQVACGDRIRGKGDKR